MKVHRQFVNLDVVFNFVEEGDEFFGDLGDDAVLKTVNHRTVGKERHFRIDWRYGFDKTFPQKQTVSGISLFLYPLNYDILTRILDKG